MELVFHYLHLVRASQEAERERLWWEVKTISHLNFFFKPKEREDVQSEAMAYALHMYPPSEVLGGAELFYQDWNSELNEKLDRLLDTSLVPSNMRLHLTCPHPEIPRYFRGSSVEAGAGDGQDCLAEGLAKVFVAEQDVGEGVEAEEAGGAHSGAAEDAGGAGEVDDLEGWLSEEWFGTRYRVRDLPEALVAACKDWFSHLMTDKSYGSLRVKEAVASLALPPPNKYISDDNRLLPAPPTPQLEPAQILETPTITCWHLLDLSHGAPRVTVSLALNSPIVDEGARSAALLRMLLEVLELRLNEQRYMAEEAGMSIDITNFSFSAPCYGLRIVVYGFSGKIVALMRDLATQLADMSITPEVFAMAKEKAETDYRNRKFQQPFVHGILSSHRILDDPFWSEVRRHTCCTCAPCARHSARVLRLTD